jgi:dihydrofolate reductase
VGARRSDEFEAGITSKQRERAKQGERVRVLVVNHISLDGVLQGPGRPDEDARDGFRHGGWAHDSNDPLMGTVMGERMGSDFSWLFGRRSYDDMLAHWNQAGGSFKDGLNRVRKYVASSRPDAELPWPNSTVLSGDVPAKVAALREQEGGNLVIMGSGQLIRSLLPRDLIDELFLMIHPLVLGSGHRLFGPDREPHGLRLIDCTPTTTGVLMATYRPAERRVEEPVDAQSAVVEPTS